MLRYCSEETGSWKSRGCLLSWIAHAMPTVSAAPRKLLLKVPPGSPPFERSWNVGNTRPGHASVCRSTTPPEMNALPCPHPCCDSSSGGCTPAPTQHKLHFVMLSVLCSSHPRITLNQCHSPDQHQHTDRAGQAWQRFAGQMNKRGK